MRPTPTNPNTPAAAPAATAPRSGRRSPTPWRRASALRRQRLPAGWGRGRPLHGRGSTRSSGSPWRRGGRGRCSSGNAGPSRWPVERLGTPPLSRWGFPLAPFAVDYEFIPTDDGGMEVICGVAQNLRTGETLRRFGDEMGGAPFFDVGRGAVLIAYNAQAEMEAHIALGWPLPQNVICL